MQSSTKAFAVVGAKPAGLALHSSNHPGTVTAAFAWK